MKQNYQNKTILAIGLSVLCYLTIGEIANAQARKPCKIKNMGGKHPEKICEIIDYLENFKKYADQGPTHNIYIIEGNTGMGKTTVSKAIPEEAKVDSVYHKGDEIISENSKSKNENDSNSGHQIKKACKEAKEKTQGGKKPVILIFDDIENYAREDIYTQGSAAQAAYRALHSKLDELVNKREIIILLVTKNIMDINKAIRERATIISYPPTTEEDRRDIFNHYKNKYSHNISDETINTVVKKHPKFKARDIQISVSHAKFLSIADDDKDIRNKHLIEACEKKQKELDIDNPTYFMIFKNYISGFFSSK